jgi:hypothetical protein
MDEVRPKRRRVGKFSNLKLAIGIFILILTGLLVLGLRERKKVDASPVPAHIQQVVKFPIYYPDPAKLPAGYHLNSQSFQSPQTGVVVYSVVYNNGQKMVFSLQAKPSTAELASFNKRYIPIHSQVLTLVGTATEGAINQQTVVSLPVDQSGTWIIVTAPQNAYGTDELTQVLRAIKKSR